MHFFNISDIDKTISLPSNLIKEHESYILEELEPSKTADYLFQYGVFDIDIHDEVEKTKKRTHKAMMVLNHLKKNPECLPTFVHVLKVSNQDEILSKILKQENEQPLTPQGKKPDIS